MLHDTFIISVENENNDGKCRINIINSSGKHIVPSENLSKDSGNSSRNSSTSCSNVDSGVASQEEDYIENDAKGDDSPVTRKLIANKEEDDKKNGGLKLSCERKR